MLSWGVGLRVANISNPRRPVEVGRYDMPHAFGSVPGEANWDPEADLDGDEEVTSADFGILVRNFGAIGDE